MESHTNSYNISMLIDIELLYNLTYTGNAYEHVSKTDHK